MNAFSRRLALVATVALVGTIGLGAARATAAPAAASTTVVGTATDAPAVDVAVGGATTIDPAADPEMQRWQDEMNAEQRELSDYLTAHGITNTVHDDADGVWVEYDYNDEATSNAIDDFYWAKYPIAQADIDSMNAEQQQLVDFLTGKGIAASLTTDRHGLATADYEWSDAVSAALDEFYGVGDDGGVLMSATAE